MYKVVRAFSAEELEKLLNDAARDGWRMHSFQTAAYDSRLWHVAVLSKDGR